MFKASDEALPAAWSLRGDLTLLALVLSLASTTTRSPYFTLAAITSTPARARMIFMKFFRAAHAPPARRSGPDRIAVVVEDNGGVAVEADGGAIFRGALPLAVRDDDGLADSPFFPRVPEWPLSPTPR